MEGKMKYAIIGILILAAIALFSQSAVAGSDIPGDEKVVVRFHNPDQAVAKGFLSPKYDVGAYRPGVYLDIVTTMAEYRDLVKRGFDVEVTQTETQISKNLKKKSRDVLEGYRDYEQTLAELQEIEAAHPDICKLYDIGDSWGKIYYEDGDEDYADFNHEIWAMKVSDNVAVEEDEPGIYYMGLHHSREPMSLEVTMAILNHLIENYGTEETITQRVNDSQIWFVPLMNPNGHKIVTSQIENLWRKNIRDNNANGQFDDDDRNGYGPDGVDPNRNYGFEWGPVGTSNDTDSSVYHGPEPFSELENQAIKALLDSHHFLAGVSYHTHGEWVLYPYGHADGAVAPDMDALEELGVAMAEATPGFVNEDGTTQYPHGHYDPAPAWGLYPTQGDLNDYSYGVHGTFSYTIELAREFIPPPDAIPVICEDNIEAAMIMLDRPSRSTLTGHITDAATGAAIEAEIFVHGIDDNMKGMDDRYLNAPEYRHPYKSRAAFGRYYRMLTDGVYDVTFRAPGYESVTHTNLQVTSAAQTVVNVPMQRSACPVNSVNEAAILPGMIGGCIFIPLSGTNVDTWAITYKGKTTIVPGTKIMHQVEGLLKDMDQVTVTARGFGPDGSPCDDAKVCTINIYSPANCPVNQVNTDDLPQVRIGGSVTIPLKGTDVASWGITYDGKTALVPGGQTSYELTGLEGGASEVTVTANGFDASGQPCPDEVGFVLDFSLPVGTNPTLTPSGPYSPKDKITLQIQTTNAISVRISDGISLENVAMTPASSPLEPDYAPDWTFYTNMWTYEYTASLPTSVTGEVTGPDGKSVAVTWYMDVQTESRTVSGKVTDANTGWPLFASINYELGTVWTDPVTGQYSVPMPASDYTFTVNAWTGGYETASQTVAASETAVDFALNADSGCGAPGYQLGGMFLETFDNCSLPSGWMVNDTIGAGDVWAFDDPGGRENQTGGSGCFAISDSDHAGEVNMDTELTSPAIDCSALTQVTLDFKYDFDTFSGADVADVNVSNDGGATWTTIWTRTGNDDRGPQRAAIDITGQAAGQADVRIRFHHSNAFYEVFWQIDDVRVYDPNVLPCGVPASGGLVVGNVSNVTTGQFLSLATIDDGQGHAAATAAMPDQPAGNSGFYSLYLPASGSANLSVFRPGYVSDQGMATVPQLGVVRRDFQLTTEDPGEALDNTELAWTFSGDFEWLTQREITSDGSDAIQNGDIADNQTVEVSTTLTGPGRVVFHWKVSSEENWDYLSFYIDDELATQISGEVDWHEEHVELPLGSHDLRWAYEKDGSVSEGEDSGWLDQISFDPRTPVTPETQISGDGVTISWPPVSATGVQGYHMYRNSVKITETPVTGDTFTDETPPMWIDQCYAVTAVYADGESAFSGPSCLMPHGAVLYVDAEAAGGNMGSSWTHAFIQLQSALAIALPGDEIWVAGGTYRPDHDLEDGGYTDDREATFRLPKSIAIYGGFDGTETRRDQRNCRDNLTILTGDIGVAGDDEDNSFHVVTAIDTYRDTVLDGFTICDGNAVDVSWRNRVGAGMFNDNSDPTLRNIVFADNYAEYRGGAMYNQHGDPLMINVTFDGNMGGDGAAMFNRDWSWPVLVNATFVGNFGDNGGAMYNLENSMPVIINATFVNNEALDYGGAICNEDNSNPIIVNSILWDNIAVDGGYQIFDASRSRDVGSDSETLVMHSIVEGGWDGEGNLATDPMLVDADKMDLRLRSASPAIDAGDDVLLTYGGVESVQFDAVGNPRVVGTVDMGSFERAVAVGTHHSADADTDNRISLSEMLRVIQLYNIGVYHCDPDGEDGYGGGTGDMSCAAHNSDYNPTDWRISLSELLRLIQLYNSDGYVLDETTEDGISPK